MLRSRGALGRAQAQALSPPKPILFSISPRKCPIEPDSTQSHHKCLGTKVAALGGPSPTSDAEKALQRSVAARVVATPETSVSQNIDVHLKKLVEYHNNGDPSPELEAQGVLAASGVKEIVSHAGRWVAFSQRLAWGCVEP